MKDEKENYSKMETKECKDDGSTMLTRDFGSALGVLKRGFKLCRDNWNGKNMYIQYVPGDCWTVGKDDLVTASFIGIKTVDNKFVPWLANQTDILAEDWTVIV